MKKSTKSKANKSKANKSKANQYAITITWVIPTKQSSLDHIALLEDMYSYTGINFSEISFKRATKEQISKAQAISTTLKQKSQKVKV